ncbi:MAG: RnfABCDGE type electron transport complex subunit G [Desulfatiglandales bacterium]
MRQILRLFLTVALFGMLSGGLLAAVRGSTQEKIDFQQLKFVKGPVLGDILKEAGNDPLADRFTIQDGKEEVTLFVGVFDGKKKAVAMEGFGSGYGGAIGVMVAVDVENDQIMGLGVTTHSETPGLGSRAKDDPSFARQFRGMSMQDPFKIKADGGQIDALSGATVTSRGVAGGVQSVSETYKRLKPAVMEKLKE